MCGAQGGQWEVRGATGGGHAGEGTTTRPVEEAFLPSPSLAFSHRMFIEWASWLAWGKTYVPPFTELLGPES